MTSLRHWESFPTLGYIQQHVISRESWESLSPVRDSPWGNTRPWHESRRRALPMGGEYGSAWSNPEWSARDSEGRGFLCCREITIDYHRIIRVGKDLSDHQV